MNRVNRISRIHGLGVFRSFEWPDNLPDFRRYNVIYGWNGSGKTLLSRIFAGLQKGQPPSCDDVVVELSSGERLKGNEFKSALGKLKVRVFNQDFVNEAVYGSEGPKPIYVLGEKAKKSQQELDRVVKRIDEVQSKIKEKRREQRNIEQQINAICSDGAKVVRETLNIPGRQYERDEFRKDVQELAVQSDPSQHLLDAAKKQQFLDVLHAERRKKLDVLSFSFESSAALFQNAKDLCGRSVVAEVIEELRRQSNVNRWVEQGLQLHKELGARTCLFCDQPLPPQRLRTLEAHFSKEYKELVSNIEEVLKKVNAVKQEVNDLGLPDADLLYPELREQYKSKRSELDSARDQFLEALDALEKVLKEKRNNPFHDLEGTVPSLEVTDAAISAVNEVITNHNTRVDNHDQKLEQAKQKLKNHFVAEKVSEYRSLGDDLEEIKKDLNDLKRELDELERKCQELERDLVEHRRPAEELNHELASYLGHSEIQFEVEQTGYRLVRNGQPAESLSEGEKTAVAFLYFLKSLTDKEFDMKNGVVVIDDPVSSLDSTALYHAFGFMKSRVKEAGQLFILTHNFLFFRQVKDWFGYLPKQDVGYYMLNVVKDNAGRNSRLVQLDPFLRDYESEYHYLFSLVYRAANAESGSDELSQYYYLPNVIRRLLEAFLEFKVPGKGSIHKRLEGIKFDPAKKDRIRRFCDTHSHSRVIDEPEQDPVILGEAPHVAEDVMDLIRTVDQEHFNGMKQLVEEYGQ